MNTITTDDLWKRLKELNTIGIALSKEKGKSLTESLHILGKFKLNGHVDPDLFDVFVREKVYLDFARKFLDPEQIDSVDESKIPGYFP
jgi:hypothetical protein